MNTVPAVRLTVKHTNNLSKKNSETFRGNPEVINSNMTSDTSVALDSWARAFVGLTDEIYTDTEINMNYSLNQIINDEEG